MESVLLTKLKQSSDRSASTKSLMEFKSKDDSLSQTRHCAYCLKVCSLSIMKKCNSGCKKRVYCSTECQTADWSVMGSIRGVGQRHVQWCGIYECGEEDVDWELIPIPNKGLGIVAKRSLPAGYRIIVEPGLTDHQSHPGIVDLEPKGASLEDTFKFNRHTVNHGKYTVLGLRISRVNHDCRPNSEMVYDDVAKVTILYALREIKSGEEICINYSHFGNLESTQPTAKMSLKSELDLIKSVLKSRGISHCPPGCYCKDSHVRKLAREGRKLHRMMLIEASLGRLEEALKAGEELLEIHHKQINMSWIHRALLQFYLFELAIANSDTNRAQSHLLASLEIYRMIAPYSLMKERVEENWEELSSPNGEFKKCSIEKIMSVVKKTFASRLNVL